jgi:hypothetical protein
VGTTPTVLIPLVAFDTPKGPVDTAMDAFHRQTADTSRGLPPNSVFARPSADQLLSPGDSLPAGSIFGSQGAATSSAASGDEMSSSDPLAPFRNVKP